MLEKKQYWITLLVAAIAFFILFIAAYFIVMGRNKVVAPMAGQVVLEQQNVSKTLSSNQLQITRILPSTKILLCLQTNDQEKMESVTLNATSLLGLTEQELKERFKDCSIETFNEDEVKLLKTADLDSLAFKQTSEARSYALGVEGDEICIKEVVTGVVVGHIARKATDFSSYLYSLLLKESITITTMQKEALLKDASVLQRILQDYVGE
ncbi:hypothetical protein QTL86_08160 [Cellulosilyticum sp. ST5]|uniref:Uncharacterized protein n=1 Tax=Cellulosilyticum lentocellum (strain ATCC 49066 / DSM 5427 / NCIMB 11756 / RHM5) TaxID=642492 RepID=F2JP08_CELLD|nr:MULTISPECIES: hypothetical protein [Cellulosilyticum]ADZ83622.1 hypothetical protein Clole_1902 [Cellulosilyticum lentocellum DSM 5427]QEH69002.1 hypothetical protein EKH84_11640 [Cellulosilyticum sp. WCF-2]